SALAAVRGGSYRALRKSGFCFTKRVPNDVPSPVYMNQERNQDFRVFAWKRQCGEVQIVERTTSIKEAVRGFVENLAFECRE
ncbi:hypothetical protein NXH58_02675, partial [Agathobacter ruminis]|uniref:hypothetical protein n=1 Tax=Agathobacter ruminis TaxID=1712665 RepID=UPI00234C73E4